MVGRESLLPFLLERLASLPSSGEAVASERTPCVDCPMAVTMEARELLARALCGAGFSGATVLWRVMRKGGKSGKRVACECVARGAFTFQNRIQ
jgi:hypothetical protein